MIVTPLSSPPSWVASLDPRWRLLSGCCLVAACASLRGLLASAAVFLLTLHIVLLARIRWAELLSRLAILAIGLAPLVVLLPLTAGSAEAPGIGPFRWSSAAIPLALALALRVLAIGTLALVILESAPLPVTLHAARALGVPGLLVHLSLLSYRYLFLFADEFRRVRTALRVRGFHNRSSVASYATVGRVVGTLLVRGADRADRVAAAMRCRGFEGEFRSLALFTSRRRDALALLASLALAVGLLALDHSQGWTMWRSV